MKAPSSKLQAPRTRLQDLKKPQTSNVKPQRGLNGFTLIEIVISSALMALILVSAYVCLSAGFTSQKQLEPRIELLQNARVAMALMTADLRAACPLSKDDDFIGMPRQLGDIEADNLA